MLFIKLTFPLLEQALALFLYQRITYRRWSRKPAQVIKLLSSRFRFNARLNRHVIHVRRNADSLSLSLSGESTRSLAWNDRPRLRSAVITPKCEGLLVIIMIERRNIIPQGRNLLYYASRPSLLDILFYGFSDETDSSRCKR